MGAQSTAHSSSDLQSLLSGRQRNGQMSLHSSAALFALLVYLGRLTAVPPDARGQLLQAPQVRHGLHKRGDGSEDGNRRVRRNLMGFNTNDEALQKC